MASLLSSSDLHKVVHHQASITPSERLIVTFAPKSDPFRNEGFGTGFALSRGHDTIYVAQTREAWHQGIDHEELAAQILPVAAGREIIAYGSSAGAYAALYFGGALNARILALAPRNDIHPLTTISEERTRREFRHNEKLDQLPKTEYPPVILFDPHQKKDALLTHQWAATTYENAHLHPIFGVGHNVTGGMMKQNALKPLVENFMSGQLPPSPLHIWAEDSHHWHVTMAYFAEKNGDDRVALDHLLAAHDQGISHNLLLDITRIANRLNLTDIASIARAYLDQLKFERRQRKANPLGTAPEPSPPAQ